MKSGFLFISLLSGMCNNCICCLVKISINNNLHFVFVLFGEVVHKFECNIGICSCKSNNYGDINFNLFCGFDDTFSNNVALHDTSEDVNEDSFDLWVLTQNFESCFNLIS